MTAPPNVLFVMADQHNARCVGGEGHSAVQTPHLDALSRDGVRFSRAFAQSPICTPSRMSFMSGQYAHNHGYYGNSDPRGPGLPGPQGLPSLFSHFKAAGYRTGIFGKTHIAANWLEPQVDTLQDCIGFIGVDAYGQYLQNLGLGHLQDDRVLPEYAERFGPGGAAGFDARASAIPLEHSPESWVAQVAGDFITKSAAQPWLAWVSFPRPHQAWTPAREFWDMYPEDSIVLPESADESMLTKPPHQQLSRQRRAHGNRWVFEPQTYEAGRRRVLRGYYGLISQTDHFVGAILRRVEDLGLTENTIVIYTADHGDFAGEHGMIEKAPGISYDAVTRIPFIWRAPGATTAGSVCDELVESVDVLPTLIRLCGLPQLTSTDGYDISALLAGGSDAVRSAAYTEGPWAKSVRTKDWKLVHYPRAFFPSESERIGELYDMVNDPWEMTNLYADKGHRAVVAEMEGRLLDWLITSQRVNSTLPSPYGPWTDAAHFNDGRIPPAATYELAAKGQVDYL